MLLSQLNKNDKAIIKNMNANEDLVNRLTSFGIDEESEIRVIQFSLAKNTMEIECDGTAVALRIKEAEFIEVEKI